MGREEYRELVEAYKERSKKWLYGQGGRLAKLREWVSAVKTVMQLPIEKRKEGGAKPTKEEEFEFVQSFWDIVKAIDEEGDANRRRRKWGNWKSVCDEIYGENLGRGHWRNESGLEGKEILLKGEKWIAEDTAVGMREVIIEARRGLTARGRTDPVDNLLWIRRKWPWAVTIWVGTALIFNWGDGYWAWDNPAVIKEWEAFKGLWMREG